MKTFNILLAALFLLVTGSGFAQRGEHKDFNGPSKTYSKSYPAGAGDRLSIMNEYGDVTVNTWDKNEFKVDVTVKVSAANGDDQKLLNLISINDNKNGPAVNFYTKISNYHTTGREKMLINYTVWMPSKNQLSVMDHYGRINIPDMDATVIIKSFYGSVTTKNINGNLADFLISYSNASIGTIKTGKMIIEYGKADIASADVLTGVLEYSGLNVGRLDNNGSFHASYGAGVDINNLGKDFKKLDITSEYANTAIGARNTGDANFDITIENGAFKQQGNNVTILSTTPPTNSRGWSPTKNYKGRIGKGDDGKMITINSSYGSVKVY